MFHESEIHVLLLIILLMYLIHKNMVLAHKVGILTKKSEGVVPASGDNSVSDQKIKVINFNTASCGWSKKLQPTWDALAAKFQNNPNIDIIDIKCDQNPQVCEHFGIQGYPTIKKFKPTSSGTAHMFDYEGDRTIESLVKFAQE